MLVNQLQLHTFTLAVATNLKILSHCLYHNFLKVQIHQVNYNVHVLLNTTQPKYYTDDLLPEKNDTAMRDKRLANQTSSFCDGGVIFYLVAYLSGPYVMSLSKWVYNFKYLW